MYARSQIEDYACRGHELETYSFLDFVVNTYEEKIPRNEEICDSSSSHRGRPRNIQSYYLHDHPKCTSYRRVVRSGRHNTLPDIVGPFFPRPNHPSNENLYFASILALLLPWRHLEHIKDHHETFLSAFNAFLETASQSNLDVIAGIHYYYECKEAANIQHDNDMIADANQNGHDWMMNSDMQNGDDERDVDAEYISRQIHLTEEDLEAYEVSRKNEQEEDHAFAALTIAKFKNIFNDEMLTWRCESPSPDVQIAHGNDYLKLENWKQSMVLNIAKLNQDDDDVVERADETGDVSIMSYATDVDNDASIEGVEAMVEARNAEDHLERIDPEFLLKDQCRAYDIINWHLTETLEGRKPNQLLMIIAGEGGVGKSKTIQSITGNFERRQVADLLAKSAFTGIAASIVDGKTLHVVAQIPLNGHKRSQKANKRLSKFWKKKLYLIIDEMSMVSRKFFTQISASLSEGKSLGGDYNDLPFGGINVILMGDFHQFPPIGGKPLYWPNDPTRDSADDLLGRTLYEQFKIVVRLKQQVRVIDPEWLDLLEHVRNGSCRSRHIQMLQSLVISDPASLPTDFKVSPWNDAVLITPRHAVRYHWNESKSRKYCQQKEQPLFICPAYDTIQGRPLTLSERFAVASKNMARSKINERAGLPNTVELCIGMKVMVTFNVETDLDIANGARGEIIKIILDRRETSISTAQSIVNLEYPPAFVLIKLLNTKMSQLAGLEKNIIPLIPLERTFTIVEGNKTKTVTRVQLPMTGAYAFTDYRSQGQTINHVIVDIATPPTGTLTPFNIYVALSRCRGRDNIRLLREFDEKFLTTHPSEHLRIEDRRHAELEAESEEWWEKLEETMRE